MLYSIHFTCLVIVKTASKGGNAALNPFGITALYVNKMTTTALAMRISSEYTAC